MWKLAAVPRRGVFICLLLLAACEQQSERAPLVTLGDADAISLATYRERLRVAERDLGDLPVLDAEAVRRFRGRLLRELIDERLLLFEADRRGVTVSETAFRKEAKRLRSEMSARQWRRFLLDQYIDKLLTAETEALGPITDGVVKTYYQEHQDRYRRPAEFRLRQIVVSDGGLAERLRKKLRNGASFEALAEKHSLGPERERGGDLGYVRAEDLPASFEAAFRLPVGRISAVVHTEYGYHLFRVEEKRGPRRQALQDVKPEIVAWLREQRRKVARQQLLKQLHEQIDVEVNEDLWSQVTERRR